MGAALCSNGTKVVSQTIIANSKPKRTKHDKLWTAIDNNDYTTAELYLDFNEVSETDLYDQQGQTMLHLSASLGHADLLMLLVERTGAKPDMVNQQLATPLHLACRSNRISAAKFLLLCGVDVNIQDEHGQTPLLVCCVHGNLEIVHMLVEASIAGHLAEPIEVHIANNQGLTPLNCAAIKGDLEMTKCLVQRGGAKVDQASPKGCTPLIYASRGGYCEVVQYLLQKKASPFKQDSSGGTILHHAVEKSHIEVLETMLQAGVDIYSAVEIADNAGRTPLFEAVEQDLPEMVIKLTSAKESNGFQCNLNVVNYNGQTPLFLAAKQGNLELVNILLEAGADPNLNQGELSNHDDDFDETESEQEKNLLEAFKNCQTPLQVAAVLGYDDIAFTLAQKSDINYQSTSKGYTVLHLCVLANRPELIIEFVTKWHANPMIEDKLSRALLDMIYQYLPTYVECFQSILEQLKPKEQIKEADRQITGVLQGVALYDQSAATVQQEIVYFEKVDLSQMDGSQDSQVEKFYGKQIALCLAIQQNWQLKEQAMRQAVVKSERFLSKSEISEQTIKLSLVDCVQGALTAVKLTCKEKIIKIFNQALQLFNLITQSSRIDKDPKARSAMEQMLPSIVVSLLQQSEQTNQRVRGKIHESLIDLSFSITPKMVTEILYKQLSKQPQSIKATQAHLQLLSKLCQQFIIHKSRQSEVEDPLTWYLIIEQVMPFLSSTNSEVRSLSIQVLLEVQQKTALITEADLDSLELKVKQQVWSELAGVQLAEQLTDEKIATYQKVIGEKATSKDWTQREIALTQMLEYIQQVVVGADIDDTFMQQCLSLLQQSLDDRNIQIYLMAVNITGELIKKFSAKEVMIDQLPTLLQSILLRTADTNTRVRRQSCELCAQLWDLPLHKKSIKSANQMIAQLVIESSEKAIVGRIGVMVKRALLVDDLSKRPVNLVLGLDYEQLTHFACQWIMHKTTKVRQSASRLLCEICRLNVLDKRGQPFKHQILQCILGLRQSIREPLIKKINQLYPGYIHEPEIDNQKAVANEGALPSVAPSQLAIKPQIVLPHSEPLSQSQLDSLASLIELFGLQLVTCLHSQSWSSRLAALDKLQEQMHQLDPNLRDAMVAEINRNNLPPEITLKTFLQLCEQGFKDPVLKNYLKILELLQQVLPLYAKYLRQEQIKRELSPLIKQVVKKTADMKQKVREASINFLLYLSHQLDHETVCLHVLNELDFSNMQIGNSAMITSCLHLASQLQSQSKFIRAPDQLAFKEVTRVVNQGLKHQNPQVRKQAEKLFKTMYESFPTSYAAQLQGQKQSLVANLIAECSLCNAGGDQPPQLDSQVAGKETQLVSDYFDQALLARLQNPNHKQRLQAIVELRKTIQLKLSQINTKTAVQLLDPCTLLLRHLLKDDNTEVYIEALNLLKYTAGSLAAHLSQLDLHLMMGSFISLIIGSDHQIKARVASDKVVIYFCKHSGIGSIVVAKEILKLIERLNRHPDLRLVRYYGLMQLLVQQFSVVLCYQPDFMKKTLELLADSISFAQDEPQVKSAAQQLVTLLYQSDAKNLQSQVNLLDFSKKTHVKKVIIELENQQNKGLVQVKRPASPAKSLTETQFSFTTSTRLASPAMFSRRLQQSQKSDKDNMGQTEAQWPTQPPSESLPVIERKRVPGQGFISSKAAGFNRNLLNQTQGIADISNLRLSNAPAKQKNEDKLTDLPLYVPTQRTQIKRKDENTLPALVQPSMYTPTLLQRRL